MDEQTIRTEIEERIEKLYELKQSQEQPFVKGKTRINYAGRVYDDRELIWLVNSSLDFWLTHGKYADAFEKELAKYIGVTNCSLTNSGSSANLLALSALTSYKLGDERVLPGDEVITTACGFPTTLNPIYQNNLVPVFVDVTHGTYNINVDKIQDAITEKTSVIMVPHTLGNPAKIDTIMEIAEDYGLWVIEDNCDALGAEYKGKKTGSFGHLSTLSFYPAHHITTGEGGAVISITPYLKKIVDSFRDWGRDCWCNPGVDNTCLKRHDNQYGLLPPGYDHKYVYSHIGYNLKMTEMQAAIGIAQMEKLPEFVTKRRKNFNRSYNGIVNKSAMIRLPVALPDANPSWFGCPIMLNKFSPYSREGFVRFLEERNITTRMLFGGNLTKQPAYIGTKYRIHDNLDVTDNVMNELFWVGVYPGLNDEMVDYMIESINEYASGEKCVIL